jgi:hypothetical protein
LAKASSEDVVMTIPTSVGCKLNVRQTFVDKNLFVHIESGEKWQRSVESPGQNADKLTRMSLEIPKSWSYSIFVNDIFDEVTAASDESSSISQWIYAYGSGNVQFMFEKGMELGHETKTMTVFLVHSEYVESLHSLFRRLLRVLGENPKEDKKEANEKLLHFDVMTDLKLL